MGRQNGPRVEGSEGRIEEMSFVYFLRAGNDGPVKIGFTLLPSSRFSSLSGANPKGLVLLRMIEGTKENEKWLHQHFSHKRIRGEWFIYDAEMCTIVPGEIARADTLSSPCQNAVKEGAQEIVQTAGECAPGNPTIQKKIAFAADKLGMSIGRVKRLWYKEQKIITAAELDFLRAVYADLLMEAQEELGRRSAWITSKLSSLSFEANSLARECGE